jgi:hypothetical protein
MKNVPPPPHVHYPPLETVTRSHVNTETAAYYLSKRPQTLRKYAMTGHPIKPVRFNGRLSWPVDSIRRALGIAV